MRVVRNAKHLANHFAKQFSKHFARHSVKSEILEHPFPHDDDTYNNLIATCCGSSPLAWRLVSKLIYRRANNEDTTSTLRGGGSGGRP